MGRACLVQDGDGGRVVHRGGSGDGQDEADYQNATVERLRVAAQHDVGLEPPAAAGAAGKGLAGSVDSTEGPGQLDHVSTAPVENPQDVVGMAEPNPEVASD